MSQRFSNGCVVSVWDEAGITACSPEEAAYVVLARRIVHASGQESYEGTTRIDLTAATLRARRVWAEEREPTWDELTEKVARLVEYEAGCSAPRGVSEWVVKVLGPGGIKKLVTRTFVLQRHEDLGDDGGTFLPSTAPVDELGKADAMAATPGLRAIIGSAQSLFSVIPSGIAYVENAMRVSASHWEREVKRLQDACDVKDRTIIEQQQQIAEANAKIIEMLLEGLGVGQPAKPIIASDTSSRDFRSLPASASRRSRP